MNAELAPERPSATTVAGPLGPGTPHIAMLSMKHADSSNPVGLFCPGQIRTN